MRTPCIEVQKRRGRKKGAGADSGRGTAEVFSPDQIFRASKACRCFGTSVFPPSDLHHTLGLTKLHLSISYNSQGNQLQKHTIPLIQNECAFPIANSDSAVSNISQRRVPQVLASAITKHTHCADDAVRTASMNFFDSNSHTVY
jgi:hypothetical protein